MNDQVNPAGQFSAWDLVMAILSRREVAVEAILEETGFDSVDALLKWAAAVDKR